MTDEQPTNPSGPTPEPPPESPPRPEPPVWPRIDLVAIDIDGTLLSTEKLLPVTTQRVIARCVERGVKIVLASARPPRSVREIHRLLKLNTMSIHYNGALICDLPANRHWCHVPLDPQLVKSIIALARKINPRVMISVEVLDKWYTDGVEEAYMPMTAPAGRSPDFVGPLDTVLTSPVTKLMLLDEPSRLAPVRGSIAKVFAGRVAMAVSDNYLIQLMNPQADKSAALQRVATAYGIPQRHVMAIGDAPNDCGMLRWAGLGVAVANAWVEVLDAADAVVPPNDVGGVAYALQHYVLDHPERQAAEPASIAVGQVTPAME